MVDPFALIMQKVAMDNDSNRVLRAENTAHRTATTKANSDQNVARIEATAGMISDMINNSEQVTKAFGSDVPGSVIRQGATANGFQLSPQDVIAMVAKGNATDDLNALEKYGGAVKDIYDALGGISDKAGLLGNPTEHLNFTRDPSFQRVPTGAQVGASGRGGSNEPSRDNIFFLRDKNGQPIPGTAAQSPMDSLKLAKHMGLSTEYGVGSFAQPKHQGSNSQLVPIDLPATTPDPAPAPSTRPAGVGSPPNVPPPTPTPAPATGTTTFDPATGIITKPDGTQVRTR